MIFFLPMLFQYISHSVEQETIIVSFLVEMDFFTPFDEKFDEMTANN